MSKMTIEAKTLNLNKNEDLFNHFYAVVTFDGAIYKATLTCELTEKELANKIKNNRHGGFTIKINNESVGFTPVPDKTIRMSEMTLNEADPVVLKDKIELIANTVNTYITESSEALKKEIERFDELFNPPDLITIK